MGSVRGGDTLEVGHRLEWYRIDGVIGRGGFGVTYRAHDTNLDRAVAIKEYLPDAIAVRDPDRSVRPRDREQTATFEWGLGRFIDEARTLAMFSHPNIIRVHSVFERNATAYMVMEFERGRDFKHALDDGDCRRDQAALLHMLEPVLDGLSQVHQLGFIHRDIKPSNLYLREDDSLVLLDFGSARLAVMERETVLTSMISSGYSAIEQYDENVDRQGPWTDIYALGAVLHYAVTREPPPDAMRRSFAVIEDRPDPYTPIADTLGERVGDYESGFLSAIDRALSLRARDRPQSIASWRALLLDDDRTILSIGAASRIAARLHDPEPAGNDVHDGNTGIAGNAGNTGNLDNLGTDRTGGNDDEAAPPSATRGTGAPYGTVFRKRSTWIGLFAGGLAVLSVVVLLVGRSGPDTIPGGTPGEPAGARPASTSSAAANRDGVDVRVPWVAPSDAPRVDGLRDRIWTFARYHDTRDDLLAIDNLMIGEDPTRADGWTEYKWAAMHDGAYLYLLVFGPEHDRATPWSDSDALWADDNLNVFLDGDNSKSTAYDGIDDFQVMIPLQLQGRADANRRDHPDARVLQGDHSIALPDGFDYATCPCEGTQHTWELALPLAGLGIEVGRPFGIEVQIDDDIDGAGRDAKWGWRHPSRSGEDYDVTWLNPSFMGTAVLRTPPGN